MDDRLIGLALGVSVVSLSFFIDAILGYYLITGPMAVTLAALALIVRDLVIRKEDRNLRFLVGSVFISLLAVWSLSSVNVVQSSLGELCFLLAIIFLIISNIIYSKLMRKGKPIFCQGKEVSK